jgi:hypothetical protein
VEVLTPVVEVLTPVVEVLTPVVEVLTPAVEVLTPAVEVLTPAVEIAVSPSVALPGSGNRSSTFMPGKVSLQEPLSVSI